MKIFASDFDGTFIKGEIDQSVPEIKENIRQVALWRAAGNLFVFATGRSISDMIIPLSKDIDMEYDYIVCLNGGIILSNKKEVILEKTISRQAADEIMAFIRETPIPDYFATYGKKGGPGQITLIVESAKEAFDFASLFNDRFKGKASAFSNERYIDITAPGISKATGIAKIAEFRNIKSDDIFCMGDSYNDIPMLSAYHGFTLPEASDAVKAKAKAVYSTVADALKSL